MLRKTLVVPSYDLAQLSPGEQFIYNGKRYMLISHQPFYTEIARYYWIDKLFSRIASPIHATWKGFKTLVTRKGGKVDNVSRASLEGQIIKPEGLGRKYESVIVEAPGNSSRMGSNGDDGWSREVRPVQLARQRCYCKRVRRCC